jgi:hypothetical protein
MTEITPSINTVANSWVSSFIILFMVVGFYLGRKLFLLMNIGFYTRALGVCITWSWLVCKFIYEYKI